MDIKIKKLPKSQIELEITVPESEMVVSFDKAAARISQKKIIKGFRPGKAPRAIVEKQFGQMAVVEESLEDIINKSLSEAIKKENLDIISRPEVSIIQAVPDSPLKFKAVVSILPDIKLGRYKDVKPDGKEIKLNPKSAEKKEIEEALDYLLKSRADFKEVVGPAQKGDTINIDFAGKINKEIFKGGEGKDCSIVIGEGKFIPGFEDNLEGMKKGEEKEFNIKFPENYFNKDLAGKEAVFKVSVRTVKERILPSLDDDFAKSLGKFDTVDALNASIKEGIEKENTLKEKERARSMILKEIVKNSEIEIPEVLVNRELEKMISEMQTNVTRMGMTVDDYLKQIGKTVEDLKKEWYNQAEERVKASIVLMKIADEENIKISEEDLDKEAELVFSSFGISREEIQKSIDLPYFRENIRSNMINKRTLELLEELNVKQ